MSETEQKYTFRYTTDYPGAVAWERRMKWDSMPLKELKVWERRVAKRLRESYTLSFKIIMRHDKALKRIRLGIELLKAHGKTIEELRTEYRERKALRKAQLQQEKRLLREAKQWLRKEAKLRKELARQKPKST